MNPIKLANGFHSGQPPASTLSIQLHMSLQNRINERVHQHLRAQSLALNQKFYNLNNLNVQKSPIQGKFNFSSINVLTYYQKYLPISQDNQHNIIKSGGYM
jgi:hypothetical protein